MKFEIGALVAVASLMVSVQSTAADFPKSGEAEYDTYYVFENLVTIDGGAAIGAIDDFTGITRNIKGEVPFHDMSVHCLMHWTLVGENGTAMGAASRPTGTATMSSPPLTPKPITSLEGQASTEVLLARHLTPSTTSTTPSVAAMRGWSTTGSLGR